MSKQYVLDWIAANAPQPRTLHRARSSSMSDASSVSRFIGPALEGVVDEEVGWYRDWEEIMDEKEVEALLAGSHLRQDDLPMHLQSEAEREPLEIDNSTAFLLSPIVPMGGNCLLGFPSSADAQRRLRHMNEDRLIPLRRVVDSQTLVVASDIALALYARKLYARLRSHHLIPLFQSGHLNKVLEKWTLRQCRAFLTITRNILVSMQRWRTLTRDPILQTSGSTLIEGMVLLRMGTDNGPISMQLARECLKVMCQGGMIPLESAVQFVDGDGEMMQSLIECMSMSTMGVFPV